MAAPCSEPLRRAILPGLGPGAARAALGFALALAAGGAGHSASPSGEEAASAIDREIESLRSELAALALEEASVAREVETLGTREALSRREAAKAAAARAAAARELEQEERRFADLERSVEEGRHRARAALRAAYKQSGLAGYGSLFAISDPADLQRGFQHLGALARRQAEAVAEFERRRSASREALERLAAQRALLDAAVVEASREQARLGENRETRLRFLARVQQDRSMQEEAMDELSRASGLLSAAIAARTADAPQPRISVAFSRLRGALPWPAEGGLAVPFGSVRHPRFGTVTPHPGIEIRVAPGAGVGAVAAGRVVFSRRHGGYGRTVVIDHGERYVSVYAHLAAPEVSEGEDVLPGQKIGFAGEADAGGSARVYLEIRHQGKALDPLTWLRRAPRAAGASR